MQEEQELLRYWKPRIYKTEPVRTGKGDIDVSILIPVHNAMPYLYECLLSVLSQKRDGIRTEIILCETQESGAARLPQEMHALDAHQGNMYSLLMQTTAFFLTYFYQNFIIWQRQTMQTSYMPG